MPDRHRQHAPKRHRTAGHEDRQTLIFGIHAVEAALANQQRKVRRLYLTDNAEIRLRPALTARQLTHERTQPRDLDRRLGADTVHQGALLETDPLPEPDLARARGRRRRPTDRGARPGDGPAQCRCHPALGGGVRRGGPRHDASAQPAARWCARQVSLGRAGARAGGAGAEPGAGAGRAEGARADRHRPRRGGTRPPRGDRLAASAPRWCWARKARACVS